MHNGINKENSAKRDYSSRFNSGIMPNYFCKYLTGTNKYKKLKNKL